MAELSHRNKHIRFPPFTLGLKTQPQKAQAKIEKSRNTRKKKPPHPSLSLSLPQGCAQIT